MRVTDLSNNMFTAKSALYGGRGLGAYRDPLFHLWRPYPAGLFALRNHMLDAFEYARGKRKGYPAVDAYDVHRLTQTADMLFDNFRYDYVEF